MTEAHDETTMWRNAERERGGYSYDSPSFMRARQIFFNSIDGRRSRMEERDTALKALGVDGSSTVLPLLASGVLTLADALGTWRRLRASHPDGLSTKARAEAVRKQCVLIGALVTQVYESTFITDVDQE